MNADDARAVVRRYHIESKHTPRRYAEGPGQMDWASQPDPFRRYHGAEPYPLPLPRADPLPAAPLDADHLSQLLALSLGLSAWKSYQGSRWALRCNPSSGNLHPTEGYLLLPSLPAGAKGGAIAAGVHHYAPRDHLLEGRWLPEGETARRWQALLPAGGFLMGLSALFWREAWKYGVRAYRYCQLDAGHAAGAVGHAAALLGWRVRLLAGVADADLAALLGHGPDEHPDLLLWVATDPGQAWDPARVTDLAALAGAGAWRGTPDPCAFVRPWPQIGAVAAAARHPGGEPPAWLPSAPPPATGAIPLTAALLRQRRSGQRYDGRTPLTRAAFGRILAALQPRLELLPWRPTIHPVLLVHRVEGVAPGLYLLLREETDLAALRAACLPGFLWEAEEGGLWRLKGEPLAATAAFVACRQEIAGDGAFSVGLLARYRDTLAEGAWRYRHLFWEAGLLGQVLYLAAEAAGMRGTGIGCFYDDAFHDLLGLQDDQWQCVYQFTVGRALTDPRLVSEPPYAHLEG